MKKRVLHCVYSGLGGHAAVLFTMLDSSGANEFEHSVLFFGVEDLCDDYAVTCTRIGVPFTFVKKRGRIAWQSHKQVLNVVAAFRPDVIMVHGTSLAVVILGFRLLAGSRWCVVVRETQPNHQKTAIEWLGSFMAAYLSNAVVYLTEEYKAEVEKRLHARSNRKSAHVIPNGVNLTDISPRKVRPDGPLRLAMVSRLVPLKDHSTLVEALRLLVIERRHVDLELYVAGDGPLRATLEALVAAAGLTHVVRFTGVLSKQEVLELLRSVDIYVHCTLGEGMSNSILQAMASSLPVVASDVRGVSNMIVAGKDGLLVPSGSASLLADALDELLRSPELRATLGANARRKVEERWSQQVVVARYGHIFSNCAL
jgi:glycosyltransferase involved in cell wall biosynthesis